MDDATLQNGDAHNPPPPPTAVNLPSEMNGKLSPAMTSNSNPAEVTTESAGFPKSSSPLPAPTSFDFLAPSNTQIQGQTTVTPQEPADPAPQPPPAPEQASTSHIEVVPSQPLAPDSEMTFGVESEKYPQSIAHEGEAAGALETGGNGDIERSKSPQSSATGVLEHSAPASAMDTSLDIPAPIPTGVPDAPLPSPPPAPQPSHSILPAEQPQEPAPTPAAPPLDDQSLGNQSMIDAPISSPSNMAEQSLVDQPMTDAPMVLTSPLVDQPNFDHAIKDAPSPPGKASRERDEDDEDVPAAKRLKAEGESREPEFKIPDPPVHSPLMEQRPGEQATPDDDSVTPPRLSHMKKVIANLKKSAISASFREPVNPVALNIPTYFEVVKQPMDLGAVDRSLKSSSYNKVSDLVRDFNLIVDNAITFNGMDHAVTQSALKMRQSFENQMKALPPASFTLPAREEKKVTKTKEHPLRMTQRRSSTSQAPATASGRSPVTPGSGQTFALGPEGVPLIRRDSSAADGRPKRAIHPPKRRDQEFGPGRPRKKKFEWQLKFCKDVLTELKKPKHYNFAQFFYFPVDAVALNIPTYHKIIKKPMDLETAEKKLDSNQYEQATDFEADVRLIFKNCYLFNQPGDFVYSCGQQMEKLFDEKWATKDEWLAAHEPTSEPPSPGNDVEADEPSEDDDEDGTVERDDKIADLKAQIAMLSQTIGNLQSGVPKKKKKSSPPAATGSKKSGSRTKKKEKSSKSAGLPAQQQPSSTKDKKKSFSKSKPEKEHFVTDNEITYNEKQYISTGISSLSDAKMSEALKIIQSSVPSLKNTHETEIELEIDELPDNVLLKLLNFVKRHGENAPPEPEPAQQPAYASSAAAPMPSKPKKNKPMSKHEQEQQIQELKGKLGAYTGGQTSPVPVQSVEQAADSSADDDSEESEEE